VVRSQARIKPAASLDAVFRAASSVGSPLLASWSGGSATKITSMSLA
jgi:hypothetical protein